MKGDGRDIIIAILFVGCLCAGVGGLIERCRSSHSNPLCPRCESEYERGRCEGIMELQLELEKEGYAVFNGGLWQPVRDVTIFDLLEEGEK